MCPINYGATIRVIRDICTTARLARISLKQCKYRQVIPSTVSFFLSFAISLPPSMARLSHEMYKFQNPFIFNLQTIDKKLFCFFSLAFFCRLFHPRLPPLPSFLLSVFLTSLPSRLGTSVLIFYKTFVPFLSIVSTFSSFSGSINFVLD